MATVISESPNGHEAAEPDRADGVSDPPAPLSSGNWPGVIGTQPFEILTWAGNELERDGTGIDDEIVDLVRRYAPALVLFPEGRPDEETPYPTGMSDYHPRAVGLFLANARAIPKTYTTVRGVVYFVGAQILAAAGFGIVALVGGIGIDLPFILGYVAFLFVTSIVLGAAILRTSPKGEDAIRAKVAEDLNFALESYRLTAAPGRSFGSVDPAVAWKAYCKAVKEDDEGAKEYPRTVYLRVLRGSGESGLALQFWLFYAFNHWWNIHEGDWEFVTLFFGDRQAEGRELRAAAYSNHLNSLWRAPHDINTFDKDDESHPIAYVARGSHAVYFEPKRGGYEPNVVVNVPVGFAKLSLRAGRANTTGIKRDYVPRVWFRKDRQAPGSPLPYQLIALPERLDYVDPSDDIETYRRFWWMRYRGEWSKVNPFRGPARQVARWETPFAWVSSDGQADAHWEDLFRPGKPKMSLVDQPDS